MAKYKRSDFKPFRERLAEMPKEQRERIEANAAATLRAIHLAQLRKAMAMTQSGLAEKTGMKQGEISRIENHPETVQLRTMERYVRGLGGEIKIVANFPDGTQAEIPIKAGKPVKSRLSVKARKPARLPPAAE